MISLQESISKSQRISESIFDKAKVKQTKIHPYEWYEKSGKYNRDQLKVIKKAFDNKLTTEQIDLLANPIYNNKQMDVICQAMIERLEDDEVALMINPEFDENQMGAIKGAFLDDGLTVEQVKLIADPKLDGVKIFSLSKLLGPGKLPIAEVKKIMNSNYNSQQLHVMAYGYFSHLSKEQISLCLNPKFNDDQIKKLIDAFAKDKLSAEQVKVFADPKFKPQQMDEIIQGYKSGLTIDQVQTFANPGYNANKMKKMRLSL